MNYHQLYQDVILEHYRNPRNQGRVDHPTHTALGYNPLCGDRISITIEIDKSGKIASFAFEGNGCAISTASASMMTEAVLGKTREEVEKLFNQFHLLLTRVLDPEKDEHQLDELAVFSGIWKYPSRVKCASLAWHTLHNALHNIAATTTE